MDARVSTAEHSGCPVADKKKSSSLAKLTFAACLIGVATGILAASFRASLKALDALRTTLVSDLHLFNPFIGYFIFVALISIFVIAACELVAKLEPRAEGSGIPRVEAAVAGKIQLTRSRILPVKYIGGLMAMGAGLLLGREGPLVQMGGTTAVSFNRLFKFQDRDLRILIGAGAGAGLACAFSAPIAGGVFILEELVKRFDIRTSIATLCASYTGFIATFLIIGGKPDFALPHIVMPHASSIPWIVLIGLVCGALGCAYNFLIMFFLKRADNSHIPRSLRALAVAVTVASLAWFMPWMVGGGDNITQSMLFGEGEFAVCLAVLAIRFVLGPLCYAVGTPGGLFAPMLTIGSTAGVCVGLIIHAVTNDSSLSLSSFALMGMASFFAATVRAPITGLILATEMTGGDLMVPAMLGACAVSTFVATAARCEPIYDSLSHRSTQAAHYNNSFFELLKKNRPFVQGVHPKRKSQEQKDA